MGQPIIIDSEKLTQLLVLIYSKAGSRCAQSALNGISNPPLEKQLKEDIQENMLKLKIDIDTIQYIINTIDTFIDA